MSVERCFYAVVTPWYTNWLGFFKLKTQYGNHDAMVYLLAHMIEKTWLKYVAFLSAAAFLLLHFKWTM